MSNVVLDIEISGIKKLGSGKVREIFDLGDKLLIVATDRISAFDVVLPNGIPYKGRVLTALSEFWFGFFDKSIEHHFISCDISSMNASIKKQTDILQGRSMLVKKAKPFPVECVVRGYITGSGWKDYQKTGAICGIKLPAGLAESQKLGQPIFTPATKATTGHDENISFSQMAEIVGEENAGALRDLSISIYNQAHDYAYKKGIILADTKFEFGLVGKEIILIDEVLTPDSSRFWPLSQYKTGMSPPSFDKQFVRNYLESIKWDKKPPAPNLPEDIIQKTSEKYREAYRLLVGQELKKC